MKKLIMILSIMFLFLSINLFSQITSVSKDIFTKELSFPAMTKASNSFTFKVTGELCYSSATASGYTYQYFTEPFPLQCDSVLFYVEIVDKDSTEQSGDSLAIGAVLQSISPGGKPGPTDTTTFLGLSAGATVIKKYAGQGGQSAGIALTQAAHNARSGAYSSARLIIWFGYARDDKQKIKVKIYMKQMWLKN